MSSMRVALCGLLIGFCGLPAAHAAPVDYTINFTTTSGTAPASGSFTYDSAIPTFSDFIVEWNGLSFDLTASANAPVLVDPPSCLGGNNGAAATFLLLTDCTTDAQLANWQGLVSGTETAFQFIAGQTDYPYGYASAATFVSGTPTDPNGFAYGEWTVTKTPTVPEPGSLTLSLSALLALALVGKKRLAVARGRTN